MKLIIILSSFIAIQAGVIKEEPACTGFKINGVYYEPETLRDGLDRPYLLAVDHSTNILYFSYNIVENNDEFRSARLNLNTKEFHNIEGVDNGFAQTVDQETHDIYIGGSDGIYKYDYGKNKVEIIAERGSNIWNLYFNKNLYFSAFPNQFLYVLINGEAQRFKDLEDTKVDQFVIDGEDDMFYTNCTGLYSQKKGTKDAILYKETPVIRSLTADKNGRAYACFQDGIYAINKSSANLERIVELEDGFGLSFDADNNIVYSDATSIVRLKVNKDKKC